ncbi:MAG: radical SAM protein, partial [Flavobacteriales bacterium]
MHHVLIEIRRYWPYITAYKAWNALKVWATYYTSRWLGRSRHPALPMSVSIEPTTACNLGCPECPSGLKMFSRKTGNVRPEEYKRWIDELSKHIVHLNLYFQGEPFIHPDFFQLIQLTQQRKIFTSTSTNGHFLTPENSRRTIESGLDRSSIS